MTNCYRLNLEKRVCLQSICRKEREIFYIYIVKVITQRKSDADGFVIIRIYFARITIDMVAKICW